MASLNRPARQTPIYTHEGGPAQRINALESLKRTVLTCMLWEDNFYEDGQTVAQRFHEGVTKCKVEDVAKLAIEARTNMHLRHAPLLLVKEMAACFGGKIVGDTLRDVIQRPDELTEFLALYWKDGKKPLSKQVKRGLAEAFTKFDAYQLAKYNRDGAIKLRDVLFMVHAKPKTSEQAHAWKELVDGTLAAPDTWEVALSAGADKGATFTRLIQEGKLGHMALLRNLRNMVETGVSKSLVDKALTDGAARSKVLPFRFLAAARAVPQWEDIIDKAMLLAVGDPYTLTGRTLVLVDVSGSMDDALSDKSDMNRMDAATGIAILLRERCEEVAVVTFSNQIVSVPPRHGMALRDAIVNSQLHAGTWMGRAVAEAGAKAEYDRIVVVTDEQSADRVPAPRPGSKAYIINVAPNKNGVAAEGGWTRISGFSEAVIDYIHQVETQSTR